MPNPQPTSINPNSAALTLAIALALGLPGTMPAAAGESALHAMATPNGRCGDDNARDQRGADLVDGAVVDMNRLACSKVSHRTGATGAHANAHEAAAKESVSPAPASLLVTNCNSYGDGSLAAAVAYARNGETIDMTQLTCGGISTKVGNYPQPIVITKSDLTIVGPGADRLTLIGSFYAGVFGGTMGSRIFEITASGGTTTLKGFTLREGIYAGLGAPNGGCVDASNSSLSLQDVRVEGCHAYANANADALGGGLYVKGDLTMRDSTLTGNIVSGSNHSRGGGAAVMGNVHIENSTIANNSAGSGGAGGLSVAGYTAGASSIVNSTISSNRALSVAGLHSLATMAISNSTIAFNQSSLVAGTGVYVSVGSLALNSVIIANNTPAAARADLDSNGSVPITGAHNLIVQSTIAPAGTITLDPKLSPLLNFGGPTPTHALGRSSPAIDQGSNLLNLTSDQRGSGHPRVLGAMPDIGAFEGTDDVIFRNGFDAPG